MIVTIFVITLIGGLCAAYKLDSLYKRTNEYQNTQIYLKDFERLQNSRVKICNLGSTYAKYAFGAFKELKINGVNLALPSQSLEKDWYILNQYIDRLEEDGVVIIPVAACLMLFSDTPDSAAFCIILDKKHNPGYSLKKSIKVKYPLLANPKKAKVLLSDVGFHYEFLYDSQPVMMGQETAKQELENLVNVWKRLFGLNDFQSAILSDELKDKIAANQEWLRKIILLCKKKKKKAVVVTTPFSDELNLYFSDVFKNTVLYDPILYVCNCEGVLFMDYQQDPLFRKSPELFVDRGFRLNERGSKIFVRKLMRDLYDLGVMK